MLHPRKANTPPLRSTVRSVDLQACAKAKTTHSFRQVKAARSLLAWSQERLAAAADVSIPTIKRRETQDGLLGGRDDGQDPLGFRICGYRLHRRERRRPRSSAEEAAPEKELGFSGFSLTVEITTQRAFLPQIKTVSLRPMSFCPGGMLSPARTEADQ
jgi:hypothetical protein